MEQPRPIVIDLPSAACRERLDIQLAQIRKDYMNYAQEHRRYMRQRFVRRLILVDSTRRLISPLIRKMMK